ncbi:MAG: hypothetical protein OEV15_05820 [Gallionella sp.]|nr:hypothetical protein [Gallionella sp.]
MLLILVRVWKFLPSLLEQVQLLMMHPEPPLSELTLLRALLHQMHSRQA